LQRKGDNPLLSSETVPVHALSRQAQSHQESTEGSHWWQTIAASAGPFVTSIVVPILSSLGGLAVGYFTFFHNAAVEDTKQYKTIVESAVSDDEAKQRTAVRMVAYLAKSKTIEPTLGLSVLGTVARTAKTEDLRNEAVDAIENLFRVKGSLNLDPYDYVELLTLRAALSPAESSRRENLHALETDPKVTSEPDLARAAGLKLLALSHAVPNHPQTVIDLLLSIPSVIHDRDIIAREVALLFNTIKSRPKSVLAKQVADYFYELAKDKTAIVKLRLYLARCLAMQSEIVNSKDNLEKHLESVQILLKEQPNLENEIRSFLNDVLEEVPDNDELTKIVETVRSRVIEPSKPK
jgi:hypothetical protein